jgi:hypothetical protein
MGFASGMITSLKNNKRTHVSTFEIVKNYKKGKNLQVHFNKKATPCQLKKIKENLEAENKKLLTRNILLIIVTMSIIIYAIGFVKF